MTKTVRQTKHRFSDQHPSQSSRLRAGQRDARHYVSYQVNSSALGIKMPRIIESLASCLLFDYFESVYPRRARIPRTGVPSAAEGPVLEVRVAIPPQAGSIALAPVPVQH